ncbi:hypothetical protein GCM10009776_36870 [Microbacterium deminutum]|uniref:Uncharacterized protein n=1 Tax=Microbacterium deminutum TaxID=344164 RepID=A0ABP5CX63_9MICO
MADCHKSYVVRRRNVRINVVAKKRKVSPEVAEILCALEDSATDHNVSPELAELLAAYGPPPKMPSYRGDSSEYFSAVRVFERLTSTPEAAARRRAMKSYFARKQSESTPEAHGDPEGIDLPQEGRSKD